MQVLQLLQTDSSGSAQASEASGFSGIDRTLLEVEIADLQTELGRAKHDKRSNEEQYLAQIIAVSKHRSVWGLSNCAGENIWVCQAVCSQAHASVTTLLPPLHVLGTNLLSAGGSRFRGDGGWGHHGLYSTCAVQALACCGSCWLLHNASVNICPALPAAFWNACVKVVAVLLWAEGQISCCSN